MNIVNLTAHPVLVPTTRGPFLAEPAARPSEPAAHTLYVVEDFEDFDTAVWQPVVIRVTTGGVVRPARCAFAF